MQEVHFVIVISRSSSPSLLLGELELPPGHSEPPTRPSAGRLSGGAVDEGRVMLLRLIGHLLDRRRVDSLGLLRRSLRRGAPDRHPSQHAPKPASALVPTELL